MKQIDGMTLIDNYGDLDLSISETVRIIDVQPSRVTPLPGKIYRSKFSRYEGRRRTGIMGDAPAWTIVSICLGSPLVLIALVLLALI